MFRFKKASSVLLLFMLVTLALTACVNPAPEPPATATRPSEPANAQPTTAPTTGVPQDAWDRVKSTGTLLVGTSGDYPPFEYYDRSQLTGFDVELIQAIGKNLGVNVEIKDSAFDGLADALQLGRIDLAISAITETPERAAVVAFSDPYMNGTAAALAASNSNIDQLQSVRDLAGRVVAVQAGSVYEKWAQVNLVDTKLIRPRDLNAYPAIDQAVNDLKKGRNEIVLLDGAPAKTFVDQGGVKIVAERLSEQLYAMAVKQGSTQLLANVNKELLALQSNGTVAALAKKYGLIPGADISKPLPTPTPAAAPTPSTPPTAAPAPACLNDAKWVQDLTLDDKNMTAPPSIPPGAPFQKGWRMVNSGTCAWGAGYALTFAYGEPMGGTPVPVAGQIAPGQQYDFYANLIAPARPGTYQGFWQMRAANGLAFGEKVYVGISVPNLAPPVQPTQTPSTGISFTADPTTITAGNSVLFKWDVTNAKAVYFYEEGEAWQDNGVAGKDQRTEYPQQTTTFYLRVVKPDNSVETPSIRITVNQVPSAPVIRSFTINPEGQAPAGSCEDVAWDVTGSVSRVNVSRNGEMIWEAAPLKSSTNDCPPGTGTFNYLVEATGPGGSARSQKSVTYSAAPPPTSAPVPPTNTPLPPPTSAPVPPTNTSMPPTAVPPTNTPLPPPTSAPVPPTNTSVPSPLVGKNWRLGSYLAANGTTVAPLEGTAVTALFDAAGKLSGNSGCNPYNASYSVNGDSIQIGSVAGGQMMCDTPVMDQEQQYLKQLSQAVTYVVSGGSLTIRNGSNTPILLYTAP